MKESIKKEWLNELKYAQQTTQGLRIGDRFCVMGVLCNEHAIQFKQKWNKYEGDDNWKYLGEYGQTPERVLKWAELPYNEFNQVPVIYKKKETTLQKLNDEGVSFKELSIIIQEQL